MTDSPVPYKGAAGGTGGDSLHEDLNIYYNVSLLRGDRYVLG